MKAELDFLAGLKKNGMRIVKVVGTKPATPITKHSVLLFSYWSSWYPVGVHRALPPAHISGTLQKKF